MRIAMRPRPDQPLARDLKTGQQARYGVGIAVGPPADRIDRALDRGEVFADRAMFPEFVAAKLRAQPRLRLAKRFEHADRQHRASNRFKSQQHDRALDGSDFAAGANVGGRAVETGCPYLWNSLTLPQTPG